MTSLLLDTNIVSILSPNQRGLEVNQPIISWLRAREPACFLSAITLMEIQSGIEQLILAGSTRQAPELAGWLAGLAEAFGDRILAIDEPVALAAGRLDAMALANGTHPGLADLLIAATAVAHKMPVVTRNLRHFTPLDVDAVDPFNL